MPCLHTRNTLVRVFLSIITNNRQLEVLALEAVDQQNDVTYQSYNSNSPTKEGRKKP